MKTEKLSLKSIKNVLSRAELKKIMAGSGSCTPSCTDEGLAITCCQCSTGLPPPNPPFACLEFATPIEYDCNCFCQAWGYPSGVNDCPMDCDNMISNPC